MIHVVAVITAKPGNREQVWRHDERTFGRQLRSWQRGGHHPMATFLVGIAFLIAGCSMAATRPTQPEPTPTTSPGVDPIYVASPLSPPPSPSAARHPSPPAAQATALLVSATNAPLRVLGSDGMEHLEYDLLISNVFTAPLTLTAIEVVGSDGRRLLRLAGETLTANTEPVYYPVPDPSPISHIPVGGVVATVIDLVVPPGEVPARITHHIAYELPSNAPAISLIASRAVAGPELTVDFRSPLVIAPPLRGKDWLNGNGCCDAFSVHRSPRVVVDGARYVKPETFAIDWLRLRDGRRWTGDGTRNEQYFAFGAEVVSVANGTVVSVRDDMPDETPHQVPAAVKKPGDYIGNHVVVQILPDVWAVYAHLQPGSIPVRVGGRVTTGQLLGRLGNSGNSTEAHLHFQLSDGADYLTSNSLPFVFDRYTLVGTVEVAEQGAAVTDSRASPALRVVGTPRAQTGTYPLVLTVQDFAMPNARIAGVVAAWMRFKTLLTWQAAFRAPTPSAVAGDHG